MIDIKKISNLLKQASIGNITSVTSLENNYIFDSYEIESSTGNYIALALKENELENENYANQFAILQTLNQIKYPYAPRSIFINPEHTFFIMNFIDGKTLDLEDISEQDFKKIAGNIIKATLRLRDIPYDNYVKNCESLNIYVRRIGSYDSDIQKYIIERFDKTKTGNHDEKIIEWLEPLIVKYLMKVPTDYINVKPVLIHGNFNNENILYDSKLNVYFINWGEGRFSYIDKLHDDLGLAYLMSKIKTFRKYRSIAVSMYAEALKISLNEFEEIFKITEKDLHIAEIVKLLWKHSVLPSGNNQNKYEYLKLARKKIDEYKNLYG